MFFCRKEDKMICRQCYCCYSGTHIHNRSMYFVQILFQLCSYNFQLCSQLQKGENSVFSRPFADLSKYLKYLTLRCLDLSDMQFCIRLKCFRGMQILRGFWGTRILRSFYMDFVLTLYRFYANLFYVNFTDIMQCSFMPGPCSG